MKIDVIESKSLSSKWEKRYIIVEEGTENVLDDAQGYGYKTKQGAYKAWIYIKTELRHKKRKQNIQRRK